MKVSVQFDCSPEEMLDFLRGAGPIQQEFVQKLQEQIFKAWLDAGAQGVSEWQKMFASSLPSAFGFADKKSKPGA
jgi:hypothetical protein